jgi:hypothetical protein
LRLARNGELPHAERAWIFTEAARQVKSSDPTRLLGLLNEAANVAPNFTGEDGAITTHLRTGNGIMLANYNVPGFTLNAVFGPLARMDLYRSIKLAKSFSGEAPKATATLAIVSAVFNEKQKK